MAGHERDPKRERFWRKALARRERSGLTVQEFCAQEDLVATTYQHWRRELAHRDAQRTAAQSPRRPRSLTPAFIPVKLAESGTETMYPAEVLFPNGVSLRLAANIDRLTLSTLLAALRESC
jgi:transposase-like protein